MVDDLIERIYGVIGPPPSPEHALLAAANVKLSAGSAASLTPMVLGGLVGGLVAVAFGGGGFVTVVGRGNGPAARAHRALGLQPDMAVAVNRHHLLGLTTDALTRTRPRQLSAKLPLRVVEVDRLHGRSLTLRLHGVPTSLRGRPGDLAALCRTLFDVGVTPVSSDAPAA